MRLLYNKERKLSIKEVKHLIKGKKLSIKEKQLLIDESKLSLDESKLLIKKALSSNQQKFQEFCKKYYDLSSSKISDKWLNKLIFSDQSINIGSDKSWQKGIEIYSSAELPLYFNKVQYQTTAASTLSHPPTDLNHVATEDIPVSDNRAEVSKEITELPLSQERYEDLCSVYKDYCSTYEDFC